MAVNDPCRNFRKLKLDTSGWQVLPSKEDVNATGIPVPAAQVLGRTIGNQNLQMNTVIPEETIEDTDTPTPDTGAPHDARRATSASLKVSSQVSAEDGRKQPVVQPLSIKGRSSTRHGKRSMMQELAQSQTTEATESAQLENTAPNDDPRVDHAASPANDDSHDYRIGEPRWPLLQATTDELAEERNFNVEAALSPISIASPSLEGTRSPGYFFGEHSLSPSAASSPVQFPSLSDSGILSSPKLRDGQRRRTADRQNTIRRESRRSSAKSSLARSPASSFLSQFGKGAISAPEPDEDGQTIGDQGEYVIGRQIGYGGFSVIKEIYSLENQLQVMRAVKIVRKQVSGKDEDDNERLQNDFGNEVSIWRLLKHDHLLPLVAVFTNPFATFCIMEMSTGGTLFDLVRSSRRHGSASFSPRAIEQSIPVSEDCTASEGPGLPIKLVRHYLQQLASAIRYLHQDMHIVHRDIKLENCLISTQSRDLDRHPNMKVMLCDFGMADFITVEGREEPVFDTTYLGQLDHSEDNESPHIIGPSELSTNVAGSLEYASPELIKTSEPIYSPCVDIWAFGVLAHALFTADLPFRHSLPPKVQMMILRGFWDRRPLSQVCSGDSAGVHLVEQCLNMDAHKRWTIADVVGCAFLT